MQGDAQSDAYNKNVAAMTARHAIHDVLRAPAAHPHGVFQNVLEHHWRAKAPEIIARLSPSCPQTGPITAALQKLAQP